MNKKSLPRFNGRHEFWFNEEKNMIVVRNAKYHCEALSLEKTNQKGWSLCLFKEPYSFNLYNGSNYLVEKGFKFLYRI